MAPLRFASRKVSFIRRTYFNRKQAAIVGLEIFFHKSKDIFKALKRQLNFQDIISLFTDDLWRIRPETLPPKKWFIIRQMRTIVLAFRGFDEDKCSLRASALTFYSLLSIVPGVALGFGIAKGFDMQKVLEEDLLEKMQGQKEVISNIREYRKII